MPCQLRKPPTAGTARAGRRRPSQRRRGCPAAAPAAARGPGAPGHPAGLRRGGGARGGGGQASSGREACRCTCGRSLQGGQRTLQLGWLRHGAAGIGDGVGREERRPQLAPGLHRAPPRGPTESPSPQALPRSSRVPDRPSRDPRSAASPSALRSRKSKQVCRPSSPLRGPPPLPRSRRWASRSGAVVEPGSRPAWASCRSPSPAQLKLEPGACRPLPPRCLHPLAAARIPELPAGAERDPAAPAPPAACRRRSSGTLPLLPCRPAVLCPAWQVASPTPIFGASATFGGTGFGGFGGVAAKAESGAEGGEGGEGGDDEAAPEEECQVGGGGRWGAARWLCWVLANRHGWLCLPAGMCGAACLKARCARRWPPLQPTCTVLHAAPRPPATRPGRRSSSRWCSWTRWRCRRARRRRRRCSTRERGVCDRLVLLRCWALLGA